MLGYIEDILDDFCDSRIRAMTSAGPSVYDLAKVPLIVGVSILVGMSLIGAAVIHHEKQRQVPAQKIAAQSAVNTNAVRAVQTTLER